MSARKEALWRIVALLWQAVIGYVFAIIVGTIGAVWMLIDLVWQLVLGSDGLDSNSTVASYIARTLRWNVGQSLYSITGGGDGEFRALP